MNPQIAYNMLVSASNYLTALHEEFNQPVLDKARKEFTSDPGLLPHYKVDVGYATANLERWWHIRNLMRRAA